MDKQLIQDIKDLMNVVSGRADVALTARFSENGVTQFDAENLLREKLNSLYDPSDFYADPSKKMACFALIAESVEKELPKRVEKQFDLVVETATHKVGDKPRFTFKLGKKALKKFVTRGSQSGAYRKGTMDRGYIDFDYFTLVGAIRLEYREYASGFLTMSELQEVILDSATEQLYKEIQNLMKSIVDQLPANNKHIGTGFNEDEMDKVVSTVSAYGEPVIFCTKRFANSIPADLISAYDTTAINDMHEDGYVKDYKGTKIVILEQSFEDESNEVPVIDNGFAYILPTSKEKIVKVVFEGQARISEQDVFATGAKEWKYEETVGMAILYNNHIGVYHNTNI